MDSKYTFSLEQVIEVGRKLKVNFDEIPVQELQKGMEVELEHGKVNPITNITNDDPVQTAKIAVAHLNESPKYYFGLEKMEKELEEDEDNEDEDDDEDEDEDDEDVDEDDEEMYNNNRSKMASILHGHQYN